MKTRYKLQDYQRTPALNVAKLAERQQYSMLRREAAGYRYAKLPGRQ